MLDRISKVIHFPCDNSVLTHHNRHALKLANENSARDRLRIQLIMRTEKTVRNCIVMFKSDCSNRC